VPIVRSLADLLVLTILAVVPFPAAAGLSPGNGRRLNAGNPGAPHPTGATQPILRVTIAGGMEMPDLAVRDLPSVVLCGDGQAPVAAPLPDSATAPALRTTRELRLTEAGIQAVLAEAKAQTLWRSGGTRFHVYVRPVLPDETKGCPVQNAPSLPHVPNLRFGA